MCLCLSVSICTKVCGCICVRLCVCLCVWLNKIPNRYAGQADVGLRGPAEVDGVAV